MNAAPCAEFEPLLMRFADGECEADDSLRVREHLSTCSACRIGLRAITELNRRVAQSPTPPAPPDLEARIRKALLDADRPRRFPAWIPAAAAAAVLVVTAALLFRPGASSLPPFVAGGAFFHGRYLSTAPAFKAGDPNELRDYFRRALDTDVVMPFFEGGKCKGGNCRDGCPCAVDPGAAPWLLYSRGDITVSLLIARPGANPLPEHARRSRDGHDYHAFDVKGSTVIARASGSGVCLWIAKLPEEELFRSILQTTEGRDAFSGGPVSARAILCRACCRGAKWGPVTSSSGVKIETMTLIAVGKKGIDLDAFIREGQQP